MPSGMVTHSWESRCTSETCQHQSAGSKQMWPRASLAWALWSAVGRGEANRQRGVRTSQESEQAWPLRPGGWSTGPSETSIWDQSPRSLQEPEGPGMRKHKASLCANIKEDILIISCSGLLHIPIGQTVGGNRRLRWRAQGSDVSLSEIMTT